MGLSEIEHCEFFPCLVFVKKQLALLKCFYHERKLHKLIVKKLQSFIKNLWKSLKVFKDPEHHILQYVFKVLRAVPEKS